MSQHDYSIANDTGLNVRTDLNNALAAIVSQNSGATEPTTMFAYQLWADTTTGLLKLRNSANNAWVVVGTLASTNLGLLSLAGGTLTGALLAAVGAVGSPGISWAGDSNTGFYWISADKFALVVNGAAVMTFDAATYTQHNTNTGVLMPVGTTAQRPTGANGLMRYNSDLSTFEGYAGGNWKPVGGGGGGGSLLWLEDDNAPTPTLEYNAKAYLFAAALAQSLYTTIRVPSGYGAGSQIKLRMPFYSPDSSGTALLQSVATLIRPGTDAMNSTTNQRSSTNSAVTLGAGTVNIPQAVVFDLTDATGQINAIAVSPGDIIKVKLSRGSDSGASDLRGQTDTSEVTFQ